MHGSGQAARRVLEDAREEVAARLDCQPIEVVFTSGGTEADNLPLHRTLKAAARQEKADAYVFGERFYDPELALDGQGEDGAMNYHGFGLPVMQWLAGATYFNEPSKLDGVELAEILWDAYHALPPQAALWIPPLLALIGAAKAVCTNAAVDATDWAAIEDQSGLARADIEVAAEVYLAADKVICTWAMGVTQHRHSVATIQMKIGRAHV